MTRDDFNTLVEQAMAAGDYANMRPVIEKELLHYDILHSLDRHRLLDHLVTHSTDKLIHQAQQLIQNKTSEPTAPYQI